MHPHKLPLDACEFALPHVFAIFGDEVLHPRNMNEAEARVFFEALTELTQALGYFANELGILAARGRQ